MPEVTEQTATLGDQPVFWRACPGPQPPVLYLHDAPASSDEWRAFLPRTGGLAPDLPGFGRSGKRGDLDYTLDGLARFVEAFLALAGAERVRLVVHGWGAAGLVWAQRAPQRVERLVVIAAVPLLSGFRWPALARAWRAPGVGELLMGATSRWMMRRALPRPLADAVWPHFDQGTQRAVLRLHRSGGAERLARAGAGLGRIACPALVVWGERDRWVAPAFADAYGAALGGPASVERVPGAGHWPWYDRPEVIDRVAAFLGD